MGQTFENSVCNKPNSVTAPENTCFNGAKEQGTHCLSVLYYNARRILPKLDELHAIMLIRQPHIVCIVETWLSPDVSDKELNLPGYQLLRLDRNRHGGGILMYVADLLSCKVLVSGGQFNLEFLAISLTAQFLVSSFCFFIVLLLQFLISITLCCPYVLFHFLPFC